MVTERKGGEGLTDNVTFFVDVNVLCTVTRLEIMTHFTSNYQIFMFTTELYCV